MSDEFRLTTDYTNMANAVAAVQQAMASTYQQSGCLAKALEAAIFALQDHRRTAPSAVACTASTEMIS